MAKKPGEVTSSSNNGDSKGTFGNPADFPTERSVAPGSKPGATDLDIDLGEITISLAENDEEVKRIENSAEGIRNWMKTHLPKLDELQSAPKAVRIRQQNKDATKKIKDKIDSFMHHTEAAYRQAAWVEFLVHLIRQVVVGTYTETVKWLSDMVDSGYLEEGDYKAPLKAWKNYYRIPAIASFTRPEFEEVKLAMDELVKRVTEATAKNRQGRAAKLQKEANLEPAEAFAKDKEGTAFLFVPPQISEKNGNVIIRKGGFLLVEVEGGKIYPVEGVGSFEESIAQAESMGTHVRNYTLDWDWPPKRVKLVEAGFSDAQINSFYFCWNLLKRAKSLLGQTDQHEEEKQELGKEATVAPDRFFLEGHYGCVFVDFAGAWEIWTPDKSDETGKRQTREDVYPLFLLVERNKKDGKISIVSCPGHLKSFFHCCMGTYDEGEKFSGVPQPLQSVLQAQYGAEQTKELLKS